MNNLGTEELKKLEAIESLVNSLRDDMSGAPEGLGARAADTLSSWIGSWTFLCGQFAILIGYIATNAYFLGQEAFDPYPFVLLNLCLSFQAAFTAPIIIMAQNRVDAKDRRLAKKAYKAIGHVENLVQILVELEDQQLVKKIAQDSDLE